MSEDGEQFTNFCAFNNLVIGSGIVRQQTLKPALQSHKFMNLPASVNITTKLIATHAACNK